MPSHDPQGAPAEGPTFFKELDSVHDELLAMSPRELVAMNVNVHAAEFVVLGAAPGIRAYRADMVEWFGEEMAASVDRLEILARAAGQAHAYHHVTDLEVDLVPLGEAVASARALLLAEARSLAVRKLIPGRQLSCLRGTSGYKNQCVDILLLTSILRDGWAGYADQTGLDLRDVDRAEGAANQLLTALGVREQSTRAAAADLGVRAFSLLDRTYDRVRRMVAFLRWDEGDADRIAPPLRSGGRGKKRKGAPASSQPRALGPLAPPATPGLPGGDPFAAA